MVYTSKIVDRSFRNLAANNGYKGEFSDIILQDFDLDVVP